MKMGIIVKEPCATFTTFGELEIGDTFVAEYDKIFMKIEPVEDEDVGKVSAISLSGDENEIGAGELWYFMYNAKVALAKTSINVTY